MKYVLTNTQSQAPCFKQVIEAWDFGPVVPEAYHKFKQHGSGDIPTMPSYIDINAADIWHSKRNDYMDNVIAKETEY